MKPIEMIPLARGRGDLVAAWADACISSQHQLDKWIASLRGDGIKAAHPDDGWVDRQNNTVHFAYPDFDDGVEVGDRIALGWPDEWRIVKVVGVKEGLFGNDRWVFDP